MSSQPGTSAASGIAYQVAPLDPVTHLFEVRVRVPEPDPEGQRFSLPAWIPGSYLIRDFARNVVALDAEAEGARVHVTKMSKGTWVAAPASGALVVRAEIYAADWSVRNAFLDARHAFFNGSSLFLRVEGQERARCTVNISPGESALVARWRLATAMRRLTGGRFDFGEFEASGYEELIDHPVLMGELALAEFDAAGVEHAIAVCGRQEADLNRLVADIREICAAQIGFFGDPPPMDRYVFLVRVNGEGFGGLEHRASCALVCQRNDLGPANMREATRDYRQFLGLVSHEYFHLWNVKRIQPAELASADLGHEAYTRQLWIFEGITSYYDDLFLLRSRRITVGHYLELLGRTLSNVYRTPGRRRQTLEESSFDAWIKFYRPDENTINSQVSYYAKGAMVALALDLEIRLRTRNRVSLDSVMRILWQVHGRAEARPLPERAFEELAAEVSGLDLADFFDRSVRGTVDPPVGVLLGQFGVTLHTRPTESASDPGGQPGSRGEKPRPWFGLRTRVVQGRVRVAQVLDGGPAQLAGLSADDEIVALRDLRVDAENAEALFDQCEIGKPARVNLFRREELLEMTISPVEAPRDTAYLVLDDNASADQRARRDAWLQGMTAA
jgi:predicted metalloprotease with PDZ domain